VRTLSTVVAMAICIFLFCTLQTVLVSINDLLASTSANRLISRNAVSLVFNLPLAYGARIAAIPGVKRVATTAWFGGSLPAKKEGKADAGARPPRTGASSSRTWPWTRSRISRCIPSS
jgi:putative ABC transport system permease protein